MALFFVSPQIYQKSLIVANDWLFHMNRFYETAMQIKNGHFNYFQSLYGFNQSGKIVNAMYGTDFAYLAGILLLVTKTWFKFEVLLNLICFLVAGYSMYALARYNKISKNVSLACSLLYMGTPLIIWWSTTQAFSGFGAAFLPLAFIPATRMIRNREEPIHPVYFRVSIALLLSVHVFTALTAVLAVCLSANTFGSIIDLSKDRLILPFLPDTLWGNGNYLSTGNMDYNNYGFILSAIFLFQFVSSLTEWQNLKIMRKVTNSVGIVFLLSSTKYLPWNQITEIFPFLLQLQFLRRLGGVACTLLILGIGFSVDSLLLEERQKIFKKTATDLLLVAALLNGTYGWSLINNQAKRWHSDNPLSGDTDAAEQIERDPSKIKYMFGGESDWSEAFKASQKPTPDYLPTDNNTKEGYKFYSKEVLHNSLSVQKKVTVDNKLRLSWTGEENRKVLLPVIVYNNSTLELNGEKLKESDYEVSHIGSLIIENKVGENTIVIGYSPTKAFVVLGIVKMVSSLLLALYFTKKVLTKYFYRFL